MQNKILKFLSPIFFLLNVSCITPPITQMDLSKFSESFNKKTIKIFFPEFLDSHNSIIEGDGIVIILPNKKTIVIDGFTQDAEEKYVNFLNTLGIQKIDYLIATHYHGDHIGTFSKIIDSFEIGTFISNGVPINSSISENLLEKLNTTNINQQTLKEGDSIYFEDNCFISVYGPILKKNDIYNAFYNPGKTAKLINSTSLVFKLQYDNFSILFTGDMYRKGMKKILKKYKRSIKSTILKAPHHGDWATTNSLGFIRKVSPKYAIIQDTRYINRTISMRYKLFKSNILYLNSEGYILLESDGNNYKISTKEIN